MKKILMLLLIVGAVGCGHKIKRGSVVDIHWHESYQYWHTYWIGKTMYGYWQFVPARYCVKIRGVKNGDTVTSKYSMRKNEWESVQIGDTISFQ